MFIRFRGQSDSHSCEFAWTEFVPLRRSAIRSLTTRLNVPVVRERLGQKSELSHKLDHRVSFIFFSLRRTDKAGAERWRHPTLSSVAMAVCLLPVGRHQVSNESLILAQNQRWRRA